MGDGNGKEDENLLVTPCPCVFCEHLILHYANSSCLIALLMSPFVWKNILIPALILFLANTERDDVMLDSQGCVRSLFICWLWISRCACLIIVVELLTHSRKWYVTEYGLMFSFYLLGHLINTLMLGSKLSFARRESPGILLAARRNKLYSQVLCLD